MLKLVLFFALVELAGCASKPIYQAAVEPPIKKGYARICIYRQPGWGSLRTPDILLNKKVVGSISSGDVKFFDLPPGPYKISSSSLEEYEAPFIAYVGEVTYFNVNTLPTDWMGHFFAQIVHSQHATQNIKNLDYDGTRVLEKSFFEKGNTP